jgi:hypothetical protein
METPRNEVTLEELTARIKRHEETVLVQGKKMKNSNKRKRTLTDLLLCVPMLVGILLFIYIGRHFWGYVALVITVIYSSLLAPRFFNK